MVENGDVKGEKRTLLGTAMRGLNSLRRPENAIKYASLVILVVQNASQVLYLRWVSVRPVQDRFLATVCVFFQEVVKLVTCFILVCIQERSIPQCMRQMYKEIFVNWRDTLKVCVPATIYVIQNNLLYVAVANLPSAVYMVTYQLKILTTAMFTVIILRRKLSLLQWLALVFLFVGIAIVQLDQKQQQDAAKAAKAAAMKNLSLMDDNATFALDNSTDFANLATSTLKPADEKHQNLLIGLGAVLIACLLSGFAGIYFEKILKQKAEVSVWIRNVQLAVISLPVALAMVYIKDYDKATSKGFMVGFDLAVWVAVMLGSVGGLIVAVVIKFADNILKAFATSFAIVLACVCSVVLFNFSPSLMFLGGTTLVIGAIFIYSLFPYKKRYMPAPTQPPPIYNGNEKHENDAV